MKNLMLILTCCCSLIFINKAFATGPSSVVSEIRPIATNAKGEILCLTRFEENYMGAYRMMEIEYGYCIIDQTGKIIEFTTYIQKEIEETDHNMDHDKYMEERDRLDDKFKNLTDLKQLDLKGQALVNRYDFTPIDMAKTKVDKKMSRKDFQTRYKIGLGVGMQRTLKNAKSENNELGGMVHVQYVIGKVIFTHNESGPDESNEEVSYGNSFDFFASYFEGNALGYEMYKVTGIAIQK